MSTHTLIPKVTTTGELPPLILGRLDDRYARGSGNSIDVRRFGATGDGTTDDTASVQAALDAGAGQHVTFPDGDYRITTPLRAQAGTLVTGSPGATLHATGLVAFFRCYGSYNAAFTHNLAANVGRGDLELATTAAHGYQVGDVLRIISQRVATSPDAGEDRLGYATTGGPGPRFSEHIRVAEVPNPTSIILDSPLYWNGYRTNNTQETDPDAGARTILRRTNGSGDNITIRNLRLVGSNIENAVQVIRGSYALVDNVRFVQQDGGVGRFIQFEDCFASVAINCTFDSRVIDNPADPISHAGINAFHNRASTHTGFINCTGIRGTQTFDITYSANTSPFTNMWAFVKDCRSLGSRNNPLTIHPGVYGAMVDGNDFTGCASSGPGLRGNATIFTNNRITGSGASNTAGLYLYEGGARDSITTGNHISGFDVGLRINDGGSKPFEGWIGATFATNHIEDFLIGFLRTVQYGEPIPGQPQGITLDGCHFRSARDGAVAVVTAESGRGANGLTIHGGSVRLTGANTIALQVTPNSGHVYVDGWRIDAAETVVDYTGGTAESPTMLHWDNVHTPSGPLRMPAPSSDFQITAPAHTPLRMSASGSLTAVTATARWWAPPEVADPDGGWPIEGFSGWVDVTGINGLTHQEATAANGATWTRRSTNGGTTWTNWATARQSSEP